MPDKFIDAIKHRIQEYPLGYAFHVADFTDLADYDTVKQSLARLERNGKIRRSHKNNSHTYSPSS